MRARWLVPLVFAACPWANTPDGTRCTTSDDCVEGRICVSGLCQVPAAEGPDAGPDEDGGATGDAGSDDAGMTISISAECLLAGGCEEVLVTFQSGAARRSATVNGVTSASPVPWSAVETQLTATSADGGRSTSFVAWTTPCTGPRPECTFTPDASTDVHLVLGAQNYVFVSSLTHDGDFGGVAGADALCTVWAQDAGLPGNYRAWLGADGGGPVRRWGLSTSSAGLVRTDGKPFLASVSGWASKEPAMWYLPGTDEWGRRNFRQVTWTGTDELGSDAGLTCADWTSALATDSAWTGDSSHTAWSHMSVSMCSGYRALYCFRVELAGGPMVVPPTAVRRAFLSSPTANSLGGRSAFDGVCQSDATAAKLNGSFLALLATTTSTPESRFVLAGQPWARADGVVVFTPAELDAGFLEAALNQLADGGAAPPNQQVYTGSDSPAQVGDAGSTCEDWSSSSSNLSVRITQSDTSGSNSFPYGGIGCDSTGLRLFCLEH